MVKWKIKERGHGRFVVEVIGEPGSRILARDKSEFENHKIMSDYCSP